MRMKMSPCVFGTETELALVVESRGGIRPAPRELAAAIIDDIAGHSKHAPSPPPQHRLFLTNGACVYADIGGHPEMATAECSNPIDLLAQTLALRQMLAESTDTVARVYGIPVRLIANNIDYAFAGAQTYGLHFNVLVTGITHHQAADQLAPLLAAMPIISGTGKASFASGSSGFKLSQRAQHMAMVSGKHTTDSRAMITIKDEALSNNGIRLHTICFDTARSIFQLALVPAIVVMVLKVIETGKGVAGPVVLADPIQSLHSISFDPSLNAKLALRHGGSTTALDIHEHYIGAVGEFLDSTEAPAWTRQMFELWREMIANLRKDPFREIHRLDWVAKLVIFTQIIERLGLTWKEYSRWTYVLGSVRRLKATWPTLDPLHLTQTSQGRARIRRSALGVLEQYFVKHSLSWRDFPRVWNAANQLCRQCLYYHRLSADTTQKIDQLCGIAPLVTGQMIDKARTSPPTGTRAMVRGDAIRNAQTGATADWMFVQQNGRRLVMNDAFGKGASWRELKQNVKKEESQ